MENEMEQQNLQNNFFDLHKRYWTIDNIDDKAYDLLLSRIGAILVWFNIVFIEFLAYSNIIKPPRMVLNFLFGSSHLIKTTTAITYASTSAAYGISLEVYFILPFVFVNCILAIMNCDINHSTTKESIKSLVTTIVYFVGVELAHRNFKRFTYQQSYKLNYRTATRAMLRPSIYLSVSTMFLTSPGLRAIYNAVQYKCPYVYKTNNESNCNFIDIERPLFGDNDPCVLDFNSMVISLEQLRVIRNIALCSIVFYSMYNKAFLDITGVPNITHKVVLLLFFAMGCSVVVASVDPFEFNKLKFYFDLTEGYMFLLLIILLIFNLRKTCQYKSHLIMEANPTIFG